LHAVIIYDTTETTFTGNGLGGLCPSECKVTEEINGDFSLTMNHPQDENEKYSKLAVGRVIKVWTYRGYQLFRIYKIDKPIFGTIPVYARHVFYDLLDNFILDTRPSAASAATAGQAILAGCTEATDFTFASDIAGIATAYYVRTNPVAAFIGTDDQSMINRWGGEIERDNFAVKINSQIGANNGVIIAYRKNLTGLTMTEDISGAYSDICPTAVSKDGGVLKLPETYVSSTTSTLPRKRYTTTHFDDIKVGAADTGGVVQYATDGDAYTEMRARCNALFAAGLDRPAVTLAVQFASLAGVDGYDQFAALNTVDLGDTVTVKHEPLNVDLALRVISVVWDVLSERYDDLTIGDKKPNLGQTVSGIDTSVANLDQQMSGALMQGEEYNNVYINHEDGFVAEATLEDDVITIKGNAQDGWAVYINDVKAMGMRVIAGRARFVADAMTSQLDDRGFIAVGDDPTTLTPDAMYGYYDVLGNGTYVKRFKIHYTAHGAVFHAINDDDDYGYMEVGASGSNGSTTTSGGRLVCYAPNGTTGAYVAIVEGVAAIKIKDGFVRIVDNVDDTQFLSAYANNAAAVTAGLPVGALYRTGGNPDAVCIVH